MSIRRPSIYWGPLFVEPTTLNPTPSTKKMKTNIPSLRPLISLDFHLVYGTRGQRVICGSTVLMSKTVRNSLGPIGLCFGIQGLGFGGDGVAH